jgi:hypothetical protein
MVVVQTVFEASMVDGVMPWKELREEEGGSGGKTGRCDEMIETGVMVRCHGLP